MAGREAAIAVYNQTPLFLFLQDVICPELACIVVDEFRNTGFIVNEKKGEHSKPTHPNQQSYSSIWLKNLFEFLKMVEKKGKREEDRLRKQMRRNQQAQDEDEEGRGTPRVLHIKNLNSNEAILQEVTVQQLMDGDDQAVMILQTLDVSFLLHLLGNEIIQFRLSEAVLEALTEIKKQRNEMIHGNQSSKPSVEEALQKLCTSISDLLASRGKSFNFVEEKKEQCRSHTEVRYPQLHRKVFQRLQTEVNSIYEDPPFSVYPQVKYFGRNGENENVKDNLQNFVGRQCKSKAQQENQHPLVLHGSSGVGKTALVTQLTADLTKEANSAKDHQDLLVLHLNPLCRKMKQDEFWKQVGKDMERMAPKSLEEYGAENLVRVLKIYSEHILFVADWNVHQLKEIQCGVTLGTWLITHCGTPESPHPPNTLAVLSLTQPQVEEMLKSLSGSSEEIISKYQECSYKGMLTSPDIINVFSKVDRCMHFCQLLDKYVKSKAPSAINNPEELLKLGKVAFDMVRVNGGKYYSENFNEIQADVWKPFLVQEGEWNKAKAQFAFKYRVVEDFLMAKYVLQNPDATCRMWLKQYPLFKRVFRFVSSIWCENPDSIQQNLLHMKDYLSQLMDISPEHGPDAMEVDEPKLKNNFTKWTFLMTLAEDCQYQSDVIRLLAELLARKTTWHFKCRLLKEEVVKKLRFVLREVVLTQKLTVKLESGWNTDIITRLWRELSTLTNIHAQASVQISINLTESHPSFYIDKLRNLARALTLSDSSRDSHLKVIKYVGPLSCSKISRFLHHPSMQKLKELDVCVFDQPTLAEVLACKGLDDLLYVDVKFAFWRSNENTHSEESRLEISQSVPVYLTFKYFPGLQDLLRKICFPQRLSYLSIRRIFIHKNFKLDFSAFTGLSCLFLQFIPGSMEPIPNIQSSPQPIEFMDVEGRWENQNSDDDQAKQMPRRDWAKILTQNLEVPKGLQRLMLRNAMFCDDTNHFLLSQYFKKSKVKRFLMLDTDLTVAGANNLFRDLTSPPRTYDDDLSPNFKRKCTISSPPNSLLRTLPKLKQPRKSAEEREKLKVDENGRVLKNELIVSSKHAKCFLCQCSPCSCCNFNIKDYWNRLKETVLQVNMIYQVPEWRFNFSNDSCKLTVNVNACKDLRIQCRLTRLDDDTLANPSEYEWLNKFFNETLVNAQFITLIDTQLTHQGAITLAKKVWKGKETKGTPDPFSLTVCSLRHPSRREDDKYSNLVTFLKHDIEKGNDHTLVQFQFKCCCHDCCSNDKRKRSEYHLRKTYHGDIRLNNEFIYSISPRKPRLR
ncbi:hypothetical protein Pmani_019833 [Petrolisthes manimaculis]|uniref:NACHT domain-containing protein n=1 Tax=Petrolisthes manimaculis TaxID=1843537 RepID=A0AAE1U6Z5_9EUCA|nr:hypothetical protein Pmani_019833 [Petrolisthes manimaculis]